MKQIIIVISLFIFSFSNGQTKNTKTVKSKKEQELKSKLVTFPDDKSQNSEVVIDAPGSNDAVVEEKSDYIYSTAGLEHQPEYLGGMEHFLTDFHNAFNLKPTQSIKGKIYIEFIVEKDGSLSNIKIIRDLGFDSGKEALRVMELLKKKWTPAKQNGALVRCREIIPIPIEIKIND